MRTKKCLHPNVGGAVRVRPWGLIGLVGDRPWAAEYRDAPSAVRCESAISTLRHPCNQPSIRHWAAKYRGDPFAVRCESAVSTLRHLCNQPSIVARGGRAILLSYPRNPQPPIPAVCMAKTEIRLR